MLTNRVDDFLGILDDVLDALHLRRRNEGLRAVGLGGVVLQTESRLVAAMWAGVRAFPLVRGAPSCLTWVILLRKWLRPLTAGGIRSFARSCPLRVA